ncbi:MAG: tyrosine-protein phosphatase, partial [Candidatus Obscuribacterales bacterium]|nr:tyrosine-protein phosphatase [Candidatus Obscuribacterales bacterium]
MAIKSLVRFASIFSMLLTISVQQSLMAEPLTTFSASSIQEIKKVVPNFGVVSDVLLRGGQPKEGGLETLQKAGVKTIVCLRDGAEDIATEGKLAEKLGLKFVSLPMSVLKTAQKGQVQKFLSLIKDPTSQPVFVHCRQGQDRCGTMVAMYRIQEQSWPFQKAYDEMISYGFHPFFVGLSGSVFSMALGQSSKVVANTANVEHTDGTLANTLLQGAKAVGD